MITDRLNKTFALITDFFDGCRFGYEGFEGYRKSTDLYKFLRCVEELESLGFYTYIILHDVFAEKIEAEAKPGALYLVYGFNRILPKYKKLEVLVPDLGSQGIAALYRKG